MYGYISELQKGIKNPVPMTDTEVNEVKSLHLCFMTKSEKESGLAEVTDSCD